MVVIIRMIYFFEIVIKEIINIAFRLLFKQQSLLKNYFTLLTVDISLQTISDNEYDYNIIYVVIIYSLYTYSRNACIRNFKINFSIRTITLFINYNPSDNTYTYI